MKTVRILALLFLVVASTQISGQTFTLLKKVNVSTRKCSFLLDSMYVIPSSIDIRFKNSNEKIGQENYRFYFQTSEIVFSDSLCNIDSNVIISYQTFNIPLHYSVSRNRDTVRIKEYSDSVHFTDLHQTKPIVPYENDGLIQQGSLSRSISVGNTQGASLQSSLDLKLSGKLNNDVEILAVITDNNIPIQPEGNTQKIQEFDKVFILLKKNSTALQVGDIESEKPSGYFMKYQKKNQGAVFSTSFHEKSIFNSIDSSKHSMQITGGIAKGKFAKNTFNGTNGNQGPYKLTGADNEQFITIIAGSERIYLNGEIMTRGNNYDYVIDYNTAELVFTPNRIITNDSRIVAEFEYSDRNFVRSLIAGNYGYTDKKMHYWLNIFSEQDSKNTYKQQILNKNDIIALQQAGDNLPGAIVPGWDSVGFSGNYVLYEMIDTLGFDSVFVYSVNPDKAHYKVNFSFVGKNKGNYIQDKIPANGRVFKWVAPIAGIPQGEYEPYQIIIPPKKLQMASTGADFQINEKMSAGLEIAVSNNDLNTFSPFDDNDNTGSAGKVFFKHRSFFQHNNDKPVFVFDKEIIYEFVEATFAPIERFRPVEFDREWNMQSLNTRSNEHIISGILTFSKKENTLLKYRSDYFLKTNTFSGVKNQFDVNINHKKRVFLKHRISLMNSEFAAYNTVFFSQKGTVFLRHGFFIAGSGFEQEINRFVFSGDSLSDKSYSFYEFEPFIANASDSSLFQFRLWYKTRHTNKALFGLMDKAFYSDEGGIKLKTEFAPQNNLSFTGIYRITNVADTLRTNLQSDKSVLSRIEHNMMIMKGLINSLFYYEIGSGLETKKEYSYLEVAPGQGQYTWIDYNQNGIRELNEFEIANYQDEASFIRILFPSNEYIKVYTIQCNETFIVEPLKIWRNDTVFLKKILSRLSNRFQYNLSKKTTSSFLHDRFVPFSENISDTSLIALNNGFQNTVFLNRANPVWSARYRYGDNRNKMLLLNGFETRRMKIHDVHVIWNMGKSIGMEMGYKAGSIINSSEMSIQRNYSFSWNEFTPIVHFQPDIRKRFSIYANYRISESLGLSPQLHASSISAGPDIRFPVYEQHIMNFRLLYHNILFNGITNSSLAYEMLNALEPGSNFTWNITLQMSVSKALMLNFMYEGRKTENKKTIHFGSIQLKALL